MGGSACDKSDDRATLGEVSMATLIRAVNTGPEPHGLAKRRHGALNLGFYCRAESCREFFALDNDFKRELEFHLAAEPPYSAMLMRCPFCNLDQHHMVETIKLVRLSDNNKKRQARPIPSTELDDSEKRQAAYRMFVSAKEFLDAAHRCSEPQNLVPALIPMVVSLAFGCEVMLKLLHFLDANARPWGHALDQLYDGLGDVTKLEIAEILAHRGGTEKENVRLIFQVFANAFVDWRYIFEDKPRQLDAAFLFLLARVLYQVIRMRGPYLEGGAMDEIIRRGPSMHHIGIGAGGPAPMMSVFTSAKDSMRPFDTALLEEI